MRRFYRSLALNYSEGGLTRLFQKAISYILKAVYSETCWNIYIHKGFHETDSSDALLQCRLLTYQDLLDVRYAKAVAFPEEIRRRFDRKNICHGFFLNDILAVIGWSSNDYLELDSGVVFPCPSAVALFDFLTVPEFRGRGFYTNALRYLVRNCGDLGTSSICIAVDPGNTLSVKGIQRAGFGPSLSINRRRIFGLTYVSQGPVRANRLADG